MHRTPLRTLASALAGLLLVAGSNAAFAQDSSGALAKEGLPPMLDNMGYEYKDVNGAYEVTAGPSTWPCYIRVSISNNSKFVWVFAYLSELPPPSEMSAATLTNLLVANETFGPSFFSVAKDNDVPKWLYMNRSMPNQGVNPRTLRDNIENLCDNIHDSVDFWDKARWAGSQAGQTTAPTQ